MKSNPDRVQKMAMLILALFPILCYYPFITDLISLGSVLLVLLLLYILGTGEYKIKYPKPFLCVWIFVSVASLLTASVFKATLLIPGGITFCMFALSLGVIVPVFNLHYLRKYVSIISYIAIILFIIQEATFYRTGSRMVFLLPFDPTLYGGLTYRELAAAHLDSSRSCAFFCETAYYAQYLLLSLSLELFAFTEQNKLYSKQSIILAIALLFSKSGCGVVGLATLYFIKFISYNKRLSISTVSVSFLFVGAIVYFLSGWLSAGSGDFIVERSSELNSETSSGYIRIMRGYLIFDELPTINKLIGMPISEAGELAEHRGLYEGSGFIANGLQTILILHGYIGFILWFTLFFLTYKETRLIGRASFFLLLALSLMESTYLSPTMLILLGVALACKNTDPLKPVSV